MTQMAGDLELSTTESYLNPGFLGSLAGGVFMFRSPVT